jgi:starch phosphorylase
VAFINDYDLHGVHFLVQKCDVWLNNPRNPFKVCETSKIKAILYCAPHLNIGNGWWTEGYSGDSGWLINGDEHPNNAATDAANTDALYSLVEHEVVPVFCDCDSKKIQQYVEKLYAPVWP